MTAAATPPAQVVKHPALLRPSADSRVIFFRSLAVMVVAGVPLDRAVRLLQKQAEDIAMAQVCGIISDKINSGHPLSQAMSSCSGAFTKLQVRLVHMAEKAGVLDKVLQELSRYEEKERDLVLKVKSSLTYPAFILAIAFLMLIFVPPFLMKGLFQMIEGSGVKPPLITVIVMKVTEMLRHPLFYVCMAGTVFAGMTFIPPYFRLEENRRRTAERLLRVPVLGNLYRILAVARFCRALGLQMECGIPPLTALKLAAETTDNPILEHNIDAGLEALRNGASLEKSMDLVGFFPKLLLKMVQVGEESATLPDMMNRTAGMYDLELESALETFTSLLEPMVMLAMGVFVGILVLSTMLPMMQLLQNL